MKVTVHPLYLRCVCHTLIPTPQVFLPAIVGYVPDQMIQCISALLDFCYLARCSAHTTTDLELMSMTLARFHELRGIFEEVGVRPDGFSLPRQHALVHYVRSIRLFGSPNGLCSSITESKHITAVKRPWRRSNRKKPLGQMIRTLARLQQIAAARVKYARCRMLDRDVYHHALQAAGMDGSSSDREHADDERFRHEAEAMAAAGDRSSRLSAVSLSTRPSMCSSAISFDHCTLTPVH